MTFAEAAVVLIAISDVTITELAARLSEEVARRVRRTRRPILDGRLPETRPIMKHKPEYVRPHP